LVLLVGGLIVLGGIGASFASASVRWRARLLVGRLGGKEIPTRSFIRWLRPGSPVDLSPLLENHNVRAAIRNELTDEHAANEGMRVFGDNCARCHGEQGTGAVGPSLLAAILRTGDWGFFSTVKWGRPNTLMLPQPLTDNEIWETEAYVRRLLRNANSSRAKLARHPLAVNVPEGAIATSSETSDAWLTYAGGFAGHRHSRLNQVSKKNVRDLQLAWTAQFRTTEDSLQGSPLVAGDVLFVPGPPGEVEAFNARTGERQWQFERMNPTDLSLCCGTGNRGVAIVGDRVFAVTLDAHLIALEANTGH
jgi:mono/diheme cytochrome c family protein